MQTSQQQNKSQTCMFESLLQKIEMDLTNRQNEQEDDDIFQDDLSIRQHSLNSVKSSPRKWAFQHQQGSFQPVIKMIDCLMLEENKQLQKIKSSRLDQQDKIGKYLSYHKIKIEGDHDDSRQKQLKNNLNLSPRKRKRIDKQKLKLPKFKLQ